MILMFKKWSGKDIKGKKNEIMREERIMEAKKCKVAQKNLWMMEREG